MEQYNFSNSNIDLACEEVGEVLAKVGVERRDCGDLRNYLKSLARRNQSRRKRLCADTRNECVYGIDFSRIGTADLPIGSRQYLLDG